jgi:uncharacterized protein with von Willebrand factor type A (vWA) domain
MKREKMKILVFLFITILPLSLCFGQDERSEPIEVFVLFDNSASMQGVEEKAASWLEAHVAENILQPQDALTIWSVADAPSELFSGTINGPEHIAEIKTIISSIAPSNSEGNFQAAFEALLKKQSSAVNFAHSYIVLVTGMNAQSTFLSGAKTAEIIKYSTTKDFPGWKVMIISLGITEQKVRAAAAAYMRTQG